MNFYDRTKRYARTVEINPEGFNLPYKFQGKVDKEVMEWKFYRTTKRPKTLLSVRCATLSIGGVVQYG